LCVYVPEGIGVVGLPGVLVPLPGKIADVILEQADFLQALDAAIVQDGLLSLDLIGQRPHFLIEAKQLRQQDVSLDRSLFVYISN